MKKTKPALELSEPRRAVLRDRICDFFQQEYDLDLGVIGQERVLDFFLESLGEEVYNAALDAALQFLRQQQENLESDFYMLYKKR